MSQEPHARLIAQSAKRHLAALGFLRKGRSRTWIRDCGWYLIVVEFQPSGFSKGSYLNVAANLLWNVKDNLSFDIGNRIGGFVSYESEAQFATAAENLAQLAASESLSLREKLPSPVSVSDLIHVSDNDQNWDSYHLAISLALGGNSKDSKMAFSRLVNYPSRYEWEINRANECARLANLTEDLAAFREAISQSISIARATLKLPVISNPLETR